MADTWSQVSETDLALFQNLSNPDKIDVVQFRGDIARRKLSGPQQQAAAKDDFVIDIQSEDEVGAEPETEYGIDGGRSVFKEAVRQHMQSDARSGIPEPSVAFAPRRESQPVGAPQDKDEENRETNDSGAVEMPPAPRTNESIQNKRREKQRYLILLEKFRLQHGIRMTQEYTMDDPLEDIRFEAEQHQANLDTISTVTMMREGLKAGLMMIVMANNRFGPFLHLDGFSQNLNDLSKLDPALERLYYQFFRKTERSPLMEILMMVGGMVVMSHIQGLMEKFMGRAPTSTTTPSTNPEPTSAPYVSPQVVPLRPPRLAPHLPQMPTPPPSSLPPPSRSQTSIPTRRVLKPLHDRSPSPRLVEHAATKERHSMTPATRTLMKSKPPVPRFSDEPVGIPEDDEDDDISVTSTIGDLDMRRSHGLETIQEEVDNNSEVEFPHRGSRNWLEGQSVIVAVPA